MVPKRRYSETACTTTTTMAEDELQIDGLVQENPFMKKYLTLRKKCEQLQQGNERLVNRLHHVKKLVKRYQHEKKFLQNRLDTYKDNYREAQVPVMWEEDQMYSLLKPAAQVPAAMAVTPLAGARSKPAKKIKSLLKSQDQSLSSQQTTPQRTWTDSRSRDAGSHTSGDSPKRPANAFLMFCDQYRQSIQNEYIREHCTVIPQHELSKRLTLKWNSLPSEDKKTYFDMFAIEKRRRETEKSGKCLSEDSD